MKLYKLSLLAMHHLSGKVNALSQNKDGRNVKQDTQAISQHAGYITTWRF